MAETCTAAVAVGGETHDVNVSGDGFDCLTCGASDLGDGYVLTEDGAEQWHAALSGEGDA